MDENHFVLDFYDLTPFQVELTSKRVNLCYVVQTNNCTVLCRRSA
jgi:hypothetical protein